MPPNEKTMLARARRLNQEIGPFRSTWVNNPEAVRLQHLGLLPPLSMASAREALIGRDHHVALPKPMTTGIAPRRACAAWLKSAAR